MSPTTHDVIPIRETQHYWGLHPHDNVSIGKGGKVVFRTAVAFHDIAVVPTAQEWETCDVSNADTWVDTAGELKVDGAGTVTKGDIFYEFSYNADTPGTYYVVCTVDNGDHCKTGQKIILTVTDEPSNEVKKVSDEVIKVMGSAVPFWTVGVGYSNMTIDLGDSLRLVSDSVGYHDVALLDTSACGAFNNYECCNSEITPAIQSTLYSTTDYIANQEFIWTPDAAGYYEVVCAVYNGLHCRFGQRFGLTVTGSDSTGPASKTNGSPTSSASEAVPTFGTGAILPLILLFKVLAFNFGK